MFHLQEGYFFMDLSCESLVFSTKKFRNDVDVVLSLVFLLLLKKGDEVGGILETVETSDQLLRG
jgi:hypothetical protein